MIVKEYQRLAYSPEENSLANALGLYAWLSAFIERKPKDVRALIIDYLTGKTISDCFDVIDVAKSKEVDLIFDWFVEELRKAPLDELLRELNDCTYALGECVDNVPQLSSMDSSTTDIVDLLSMAETSLTYVKLGYHLYKNGSGRNEIAKRKYGENAAKFAALLDLVKVGRDIKDPETKNCVAADITRIGKAVARAGGDRKEIIARLMLRSALFRDLLNSHREDHADVFWSTVSALSPETRLRRTSAFTGMIQVFVTYGGTLPEGNRVKELICRMRR